MSDLSDFSEADFDKLQPPESSKKGLSRAKTSKPPPPPVQDDEKGSKPTSKPADKDPGKKETSKPSEGSEDDAKKAPKPRKSTREPGKRMCSVSDPQPAIDKATGVLSPPDFFISKIVHDTQCFTPKLGHSVVEANGLIYIFGGEDAEKNSTSAMVKFNPGHNGFEVVDVTGDNPGPRRGATLNVWKQHSRAEPSLFLFGGMIGAEEATSEAWSFDLKSRSWKELKLSDSPDPRHSHATVFSEKSNALYVFGGQMADGFVLEDAYVLKGTSWSQIPSAKESMAPGARCGHSASLCTIDKKTAIAIFGGDVTGSNKGDNGLWLYHPDDDDWEKIEDYAGEPPCPRWKHAAAFFDNRLWIVGGTYAGWFKNYVMSDLFVFDFYAKCWFKCDVDPKELGSHTDIGSLTVLPASRAMFIFGGADQNGYPTADVYRLAPVCTTVSLTSLRQDMSRTVGEVKQVRSEMDSTLQETQNLRNIVLRLEGVSEAVEKKVGELANTTHEAENKLNDLTKAMQTLQDSVKKLEESLTQAEASIRSFNAIEKKFGIMEVTIQEALAKLEQKADISSLRAVAAKVDSVTDDDDD